jgi:chromate transport protein ChrA
MIVANTLGGLFGILAYQLLVMAPSFIFMMLLVLLVGLVFAGKLFSDSKYGGIFGSAFSTFLLILGSVTASDDEAGSKVWDRIIQISMAVVYVVATFGLLDRISKSKSKLIK